MALVQKYRMSVNEVFVLKGIAILLIILHNFSHRLPGTVQENQHFFLAEGFDQMVSVLTNGGPNLLINLLSHYGHYGVAIFVFLCGYGLAIKYTRETTDISFAAFSLKHAKKLWLLMLPLLLPHFLFMCIKKASYFSDHIGDLLMMTTFTSGFNPDPYVFHGPWWFFSLIFQLYIVYYLSVYGRSLKPVIAITIASIILQVAIMALGSMDGIAYLSRTFVGYMLPFTVGIVFAQKSTYPSYGLALAMLVLFFVCGSNKYLWPFTFTLLPIALMPLERLARHLGRVYSFILFIGVNSAYIFIIHPIVRSSTLDLSETSVLLAYVVYLTASIAAAYYYKRLLFWAKQKITQALAERKAQRR